MTNIRRSTWLELLPELMLRHVADFLLELHQELLSVFFKRFLQNVVQRDISEGLLFFFLRFHHKFFLLRFLQEFLLMFLHESFWGFLRILSDIFLRMFPGIPPCDTSRNLLGFLQNFMLVFLHNFCREFLQKLLLACIHKFL